MNDQTTAPLLPRREYLARLARSIALGLSIIAVCLGIGMVGYHTLEKLSWIDAFLNAAISSLALLRSAFIRSVVVANASTHNPGLACDGWSMLHQFYKRQRLLVPAHGRDDGRLAQWCEVGSPHSMPNACI